MKANERIQTVYRGEIPDQVPLMLDLSHWYKRNLKTGFNLAGYTRVEQGLVDLHKQVGVAAYVEMGGFYSLAPDDPDVKLESRTENGVFSTRIVTPVGTLHEERVFSDNYDSNVQTKDFFDRYVRDYYTEVARRLHARGKYLAVHVDGESRGVLGWLAECGVDCADALTPAPMFALTPAQMRDQAGPDLILSGGIPPTIFGPGVSDRQFDDCVKRWLDARLASPRLIMAAGDQVPIEAPFERIVRLPELVERYGRY